ncbi:MAG: glycosyltransferase family 2 protein [Candidatus Methylacidiphilaceae bacterium]
MSTALPKARFGICVLLPGSLALSSPEGTIYLDLARRLASSGRSVTLLQAGDLGQSILPDSDGAESSRLRRLALREPKTPSIEGHWSGHARESYLAFLWLREREAEFGLVYFPARSGIGYFAAVAKRQGLAFAGTVLVAGECSSEEEPGDLDGLERIFLERESALRADAVLPAGDDGLLRLLEQQPPEAAAEALSEEPAPLVTVCLVHHDRPRLLAQALDSLRGQKYPHFEVILADSGSERPEALAFVDGLEGEFSQRGWRILRLENRGPGAARNRAAREARGEFLFFMDDDNVALPEEFSCFVQVSRRTSADIVTCAQAVFHGEEPPPLDRPPDRVCVFPGAFLPVALFRDCFGDTNALIRREVFTSLGGFSEDDNFATEDWELFIRARLAGFQLEAIPLPLFFYRVQPESRFRTTCPEANRRAIRRPYREYLPPDLHGLLSLVQGQALRIEALETEVRSLSAALASPAPLPVSTKRSGPLREIERTVRKARKALFRRTAGAKPASPYP